MCVCIYIFLINIIFKYKYNIVKPHWTIQVQHISILADESFTYSLVQHCSRAREECRVGVMGSEALP